MNDLNVKYNYHDSYIEGIEISDNNVSLSIFLYSLTYPDTPKVRVNISGILNFESVKKYFQAILEEADPGEEIGCRVEAMHFDEKKESKENDLYIFLKTDWKGAIRVHCNLFSETV
jgi:hypothetical protein